MRQTAMCACYTKLGSVSSEFGEALGGGWSGDSATSAGSTTSGKGQSGSNQAKQSEAGRAGRTAFGSYHGAAASAPLDGEGFAEAVDTASAAAFVVIFARFTHDGGAVAFLTRFAILAFFRLVAGLQCHADAALALFALRTGILAVAFRLVDANALVAYLAFRTGILAVTFRLIDAFAFLAYLAFRAGILAVAFRLIDAFAFLAYLAFRAGILAVAFRLGYANAFVACFPFGREVVVVANLWWGDCAEDAIALLSFLAGLFFVAYNPCAEATHAFQGGGAWVVLVTGSS